MGQPILKRGPLREIIAQIGSLTDEDWICAEGGPNWTAQSPAYVIRIAEFVDLRMIGPIPDYFLEVFTAREVLDNWSALRNGRPPTVDEMTEALIYYAVHDGDIPLALRP
jgi:hypothetical protein